MVLVAFVLVLLAAISFAAGIAASRTSDTLVYISILFSVAAFVTLAIASLRARQETRELDEGLVAEPAGTGPAIEQTEAHAAPLLGGLDPSQLDMTPSWRRQSRERFDTLIDDDFDEQLENEEDEADFEVPVATIPPASPEDLGWGLDEEPGEDEEDWQEPTAAYSPVAGDVEEDEGFDEDDILDIPAPEPEPEPTEQDFFFDEYDDLTAAEILPLLRDLDLEGLEWVRARERSGAKRATVLNQVEELIVASGGRRSAAAAKKRAPAKKAAKTTARTAAKKAAPAGRATKKKSTRRR